MVSAHRRTYSNYQPFSKLLGVREARVTLASSAEDATPNSEGQTPAADSAQGDDNSNDGGSVDDASDADGNDESGDDAAGAQGGNDDDDGGDDDDEEEEEDYDEDDEDDEDDGTWQQCTCIHPDTRKVCCRRGGCTIERPGR